MSSMEIDDEIDDDMPFELMEHAKAAALEILPIKSREKYLRAYQNFKDWQMKYGVSKISSVLIMAYFHVLEEKKYKPTTLWALHSMLKATLRANEDVDIGKFTQVSAFLKTKSAGFKSIKAEVFTEAGIKKFIDEAEDLQWLDVKVACIFGICGACRTEEFPRFTVDDLETHGSLFLVKVQKTKTKISRSFTIHGKFAEIVRKYMALRPQRVKSNEPIFINYQKGKCTVQFIGKNKFSKMPRRVAEYLILPLPERYTGHSFRRTSATFLANSGADMETIMRHGGWRNESCAKGYIEDSLGYKKRTGQMIQSSILGQETIPLEESTSSVEESASFNADNEIDVFNCGIDENDLLDAVDRASQDYEVERRSQNSDNSTDQHESDGERPGYRIGVSNRDSRVNENASSSNVLPTSSAVLTQSVTNNSVLNAILSHSLKTVHFDKLENCTFNFYLSNK